MKKKVSLLLVIALLFCCFASTPTVAFAYDGAKPLPALSGVQSEDVAKIALSQVGYREDANGATVYGAWWGLPYGEWCAMFACWCANQAGAGFDKNSGASAQVTALFNYICKTGSYDITFQTDPRPGDFLFFKDADPTKRLPHVGIVTGYDSATKTVTYVDGNNGKVVKDRTCKWESGAKVGSQYVYGYGRPAYSNSPIVVTSTTPELTSEKYIYNVGENITLQRNMVQNSNYYWLSLWHDGKEVLATSMDDVTYTLPKLEMGLYAAILTVGNTNFTLSSEFAFVVQDTNNKSTSLSEQPVITSDKNVYLVGNEVILQRNTVKNSAYHYFEMWRDGKRVLSTDMEPKHVLSGLQPGFYEVYLQVKNGNDKALANCTFIVQDESTLLSPQPMIIPDHYVHNVGENVILQRNTVNNSNYHWITVWHDGEQILSTNMDNMLYTLSNLKVGFYDVFLQVGNEIATEQTSCSFVVQNTSNQSTSLSSHPVITTDKEKYALGAEVVLERNTVKNSDYHWICLWHNGILILSTEMDKTTYVLSDLELGYYDVYLQVGNGKDKEIVNCTFAVEEFGMKEHEHDFSEYTIDKKATLNEWGTVTFTCSGCDATEEYGIPEIGAVLLAKHEYTYNGKKNKPSVTVIDVEGNKLVKGTDYSVKYSGDGKEEGRYKVTVTFKGIYSGTRNLYYYVVPKEQ